MAAMLQDYGESLRAFVNGYRGSYERSVHRAPDVFDLFAKLFADPRVEHELRVVVNCVLGYFVAPGDVMPEETIGPYGVLDDLFVATHAFRRLRHELPAEVLDEAWCGQGDLDEVMTLIHTESRAAVGKKGREALRLAGIG